MRRVLGQPSVSHLTSVDRDDLRDGGAGHFVECIRRTRELSPATTIEVLVPDFRGRDDRALDKLTAAPPDVMNHKLETVPRLYKEARPGSDYAFSPNLLKKFQALFPHIPTKSGLMVGLGETDDEILQVMRDMRAYDNGMLTIGQYQERLRHLVMFEPASSIYELEHEIQRANVVRPQDVPRDVVTMNSRALLRVDGADLEAALVYREHADDTAERFSVGSALGTAILGYREGDAIDWRIWERTCRVQIGRMLYQPEAAGVLDL